MARRTILDNLVSEGIITAEEAQNISEKVAGNDERLDEFLLQENIPEREIVRAKSSFFGVPAFFLGEEKVPFDVLKYVPEESASHYQFVPVAVSDGVLSVGMVHPEDIEAREALKFISSNVNLPTKIFIISASDFQRVLKQYKGIGGEVGQALDELELQIAHDQKKEEEQKGKQGEKSERLFVEDAPVTKIVAVILKHATEGHASDIHIEPERERVRVRFRLDGVLYTSLFLPVGVQDAIAARIKILTNLQLDEKRKPQDGRFSARIEGHDVDFRVSTFPTYFGEKVVIRILDSYKGVKILPELGLSGRNLKVVEEGIKHPHGMILLTGPTGSGKTTTLYAILQLLNQEGFNVISLEDPVEYSIVGVNQSQVRPEIGYTFASGLRSVLRQDPDIIMVGEIRDKETAQLAIHAALTGHLVLSTLHTNTAVGVIPRLIDMGVDPFLIPATLLLAIGQRLVRTLCEDSKKPIAVSGLVKEALEEGILGMPPDMQKDLALPAEIYQAFPSGSCPKGTRGRMGVFEVLAMTPQLEKLILEDQPSEAKISEEAKRQGMVTMRQDGIVKVLEGKIGLEELSEVVL